MSGPESSQKPGRRGRGRIVAIKKSDLYSSLWKSCDELRGGMDASQYKDYILTLLFLKYVSDKHEADPDSLIEVPDGCTFEDIVALKGNKEIGEGIDKIIAKLADVNDLRGVIDVTSFNDDEKLGRGQEMVDRLSKLVTIFDQLDFRATRPDGDDLLGDAYEYLMRHFATESGKSKGQFYTPAEVSRILAKVVGIGPNARQNETIYDPTCGSGSLLLKAADEAPHGLTIYGQEKDGATWALARMNMILHGYETAEIEKGDTITSPGFASGDQLKLHDFVVANPPFSTKSWSSGISPASDPYKRFELGIPPAKNGDYAFLLHAIKSLKSTGKAAIILPHGVLFRGNVEATIRRNLLTRGLIKGVIGLPPNLFYGTGIPACIVVIDKDKATERESVFLIDASKGYRKDGNKNRLRAQDIHKIVDVFTNQIELEGYSRLVPLTEIANDVNAYNLNIARYIDASEPEDLQDLDAHLNGGIPDHDLELLGDYWSAFPSLQAELFKAGRPGYSRAKVEAHEVQAAVEANPDFQAFADEVMKTLSDWWAEHQELLAGFDEGAAPKPVIYELSESLLKRFTSVPLLSRYHVYERLMTYWEEVMQDDLYLISAEGWVGAAKPRGLREIGKQSNGRPKYEEPDLVLGSGKSTEKLKMDLIPPALIARHYFSEQVAELDARQQALDQATQVLEEYVEENGVEGGPLEEVVDEKGKVTGKRVRAELKELEGQPELAEEVAALEKVSGLLDAEAGAKKAVKEAQAGLNLATKDQYPELSEDDLRTLVIEEKWFSDIKVLVADEVNLRLHALVGRIQTLEGRYADTLPALEQQLEELQGEVEKHLHKMGLTWSEAA